MAKSIETATAAEVIEYARSRAQDFLAPLREKRRMISDQIQQLHAELEALDRGQAGIMKKLGMAMPEADGAAPARRGPGRKKASQSGGGGGGRGKRSPRGEMKAGVLSALTGTPQSPSDIAAKMLENGFKPSGKTPLGIRVSQELLKLVESGEAEKGGRGEYTKGRG